MSAAYKRPGGGLFFMMDAEFRDHPRISGAELADVPPEWRPAVRIAMLGLFAACLGWLRTHMSNDGVIPKATVRAMVGANSSADPGEQVVRAMVATGLLEDDGSASFTVRNYAAKNATGEQIRKQKASNAKAAKDYRNKKKTKQNAEVSDPQRHASVMHDAGMTSLSLSSSSSDLDRGERERGEASKASRLADREGRCRARFVQGVARGKGTPYAWPDGYNDQAALNTVIATFAKGPDGKLLHAEALLEWIDRRSGEYATALRESGQDPRFWNDYGPRGWLKFENNGGRIGAATAGASRPLQAAVSGERAWSVGR